MNADDFEPMDNVGSQRLYPRSERGCRSVQQYISAAIRTSHSMVSGDRRSPKEGLLPRRPARRHQPHSINASSDMEPAGPTCHAFP
ncbi:hypothetical protein MRX96_041202 [Rhipicephalus microplus]